MSRKTVSLRRNADGTATFRYEGYVQHVDVANLGLLETYEHVKFAAICAGLQLSEETLDELFRAARGLVEG